MKSSIFIQNTILHCLPCDLKSYVFIESIREKMKKVMVVIERKKENRLEWFRAEITRKCGDVYENEREDRW